MKPRTAAKWVEAHEHCLKNRSVPAILASIAAKKYKPALAALMDKKPALRLPRGSKKKTNAGQKQDIKKELEAACKAIIFSRDCGSSEGREGTCISCQQYRVLQWGHFIRQQDSAWLKYDPRNTGGQCRACNMAGGNVLNYAKAIDKRDGPGSADALQAEALRHKFWRPTKANLKEKLDALLRLLPPPAPERIDP